MNNIEDTFKPLEGLLKAEFDKLDALLNESDLTPEQKAELLKIRNSIHSAIGQDNPDKIFEAFKNYNENTNG